MVQTAVSRSIGSRSARAFAALVCLLFVGTGLALLTPSSQAAVADEPTSCGPIIEDHEGRYCITQSGLMKTFSSTTGEFLGYIHGGDPKYLLKDPFADEAEADAMGAPQLSGNAYPDARAPHCVAPTSPDPDYYAHVIYARYQGEPDTYATNIALIRDIIRQANGLLHDTAKELGKPLLYKVKCDAGEILVSEAVLSGSCGAPSDCFNDMVTKLRNIGYNDPKVKYWVWTENDGCTCGGKGHVMPDDSLSVNNQNNGNSGSSMFAITFHGDKGVRIMMHENGHNMGAVQDYSTGQNGANNQGHCWDGNDIMCYEEPGEAKDYHGSPQLDGSGPPPVCAGSDHWDCNSDTYFHPKPLAGSYLESHWNLASPLNRYLVAGNAMPDAVADAYVMDEDTILPPVDLLANDEDEEDDPLFLHAIEAPPSGATVEIKNNKMVYTPPKDFFGTDVFEYTVRDRLDPTNETIMFGKAMVEVEVRPINDAPVASDNQIMTPEDTPIDLTLDASDTEGSPLVWEISKPVFGDVLGTPPDITYQPRADIAGPDAFTFKVTDPEGLSATATIDIEILPRPDPPNARDDALLVIDGVPDWPLDVLANDDAGPGSEVEQESIAIQSYGPGGVSVNGATLSVDDRGTIETDDDQLLFTPPTAWPGDFDGTDSFTYTIRDTGTPSKTATATVTVRVQPDHLAAFPDKYETTEDTTLAVPWQEGVLWNPSHAIPSTSGKDPADHWPGKPSMDDVAVILLEGPSHGVLNLGPDGAFTYVPDDDFHGSDAFRYFLRTPDGDSNPARVDLEVGAVNDPPVAPDLDIGLNEDTKVPLVLTASDVEDDVAAPPVPVEIAIAQSPVHGRIQGTPPDIVYYPKPQYFGDDVFTYRATDSEGAEAVGVVRLTIAAVNDAPVAVPDAYLARPDTRNMFPAGQSPLKNDVEPDNDRMRMEVTLEPRRGQLTIASDGGFSYTPQPGFLGADQFQYRAVDPDGLVSLPATVRIDVAHNIPPDAHFELLEPAYQAGEFVEVRESSQDLDGSIISYHWDFGDGNTSTERAPSFAYNEPGIYDIILTVRDDDAEEGKHVRTVTVSGTFGAEFGGDLDASLPVAVAGDDRTALEGASVMLDGSGSSSPDEKPLTYRWTQVSGVPVTLHDADTPAPYFEAPTVDKATSLVFALVVFDGDQYAKPDEVAIYIFPEEGHIEFVADAGNEITTLAGAKTRLVAGLEGSTETAAFVWKQLAGPSVMLAHAGPAATFVAPYVTTTTELVFEVTATRGTQTSIPDQVRVFVEPATPPMGIDAQGTGPKRVFAPLVAIDTPELQYTWDLGDGNVREGLAVEHAYTEPGTYTVRLTASNSAGYEETWQQEVVVPAEEQPVIIQDVETKTPAGSTWLVVGAIALALVAALGGASLWLTRRSAGVEPEVEGLDLDDAW